jgi:RNA polymerase sigma-70 factor (ECF subfamily)
MDAVEASEETLSRAFDRAWVLALVREAVTRQAARAGDAGAVRRVEILRLRFQEDLPIREIARRLDAEATVLHHEYARAREEFREALLEVVAEEHPGTRGEIERRCASLLALIRGRE